MSDPPSSQTTRDLELEATQSFLELENMKRQCAEVEEELREALEIAETETEASRSKQKTIDELAQELERLQGKGSEAAGGESSDEENQKLRQGLVQAQSMIKEMEEEAVRAMEERSSLQKRVRSSKELADKLEADLLQRTRQVEELQAIVSSQEAKEDKERKVGASEEGSFAAPGAGRTIDRSKEEEEEVKEEIAKLLVCVETTERFLFSLSQV